VSFSYKGDYINGEFIADFSKEGVISTVSPGDFKDKVFEGEYCYAHIDQACEAANEAFKSWKWLSLDDRKKYLMKLKDVYSEHKDELAELISRETGKPLWETLGEVGAMIGKISITVDHSIKLVQEQKLEGALPGVNGFIRFKPRGVMAVLGPFNFPGHLPNGHIVPALLTGNTVVFKPSEKTAAVGQFIAELIHKAGFPPGVFNLVQGLGETGKRIVSHDLVDGVLFTGSYDVGLKIKQETLQQHWKLLALEMGGKNSAIIWDDHNFDKMIYENLVGAFITAGQRCSCTSRIILKRNVADKFIERYKTLTEKLKVGHWKEKSFMGPLIDSQSKESFLRFQEIAQREGAEVISLGKSAEVESYEGNYVTPSIMKMKSYDKESVYQNTEIFGPNVAIYTVDELEEAFEITNASGFGLVTAVFSKDREPYEKALLEAKVGLVNWNRTTNGASSKLPFGGMGKSGNDRPSAHFAVNYCTVPVGSLEDMTEFDKTKVFPGVEL